MSDSLWSKAFWSAATERAVKAAAWSASSTLIADHAAGILSASWVDVLSVAGMAAVLSVLGSVVSDAATDGTGPSLTNAERLDP